MIRVMPFLLVLSRYSTFWSEYRHWKRQDHWPVNWLLNEPPRSVDQQMFFISLGDCPAVKRRFKFGSVEEMRHVHIWAGQNLTPECVIGSGDVVTSNGVMNSETQIYGQCISIQLILSGNLHEFYSYFNHKISPFECSLPQVQCRQHVRSRTLWRPAALPVSNFSSPTARMPGAAPFLRLPSV
jgi:hypothetical protein